MSSQVTQVEKAASTPVKYTPRPAADFSTLDDSKYTNTAEQLSVAGGEVVEVTELFWFGCGHCFNLERPLKSWLNTKPANAKFTKVPAIFSKRWEFHAKAFYTMKALNVEERVYDDFFTLLHVKRKPVNTENALAAFLANYGKDQKTVENAFNSFAVDSQVRNAIKITKQSGARGVPALIVDGKYLTSQSDAGGTVEMFDVIDKLIAKVAAER